jgi:hypothetical protein
MTKSWSDSAAAYIRRLDTCPRCDAMIVQPGRCINCNAQLTGPEAERVSRASRVAGNAIIARQAAIDGLITLPATVQLPAVAASAAAPAAAATSTTTAPRPVAPREGSQISVQSVLAVVGAALLGVAAIVFTFLNPDLTNFATRTTIIAVITVIFLGGAWVLVRAKLQFSAEAIGALGMVFVALDIWAFSHGAPRDVSPYVFAGIGAAFSAIVLIGIAAFARIRTWLWLGLLGLSTTPAWFGFAFHKSWWVTMGILAVGFVALVAQEIAKRLSKRMKSRLRADHWSLTALQLLVIPVVLVQSINLYSDTYSTWGLAWRTTSIFAGIALLAFISCRNELPKFWSFLIGASLGLLAYNLLNNGFSLTFEESGWAEPATQLALAAVVAILAVLSRIGSAGPHPRVSRLVMLSGAFAMLAFGFLDELGNGSSFYFSGLDSLPSPAWTWGLGLSLGMLVTALGAFSIWAIGPRRTMPQFAYAMVVVAESVAVVGLVTIAGWDELPTYAQVIVALGCAVGLSLVVSFVPGLRKARQSLRVPLLVGAHLLVIEAVAISWTDPRLSQIGGAAVVVSWIAVTVAMPRIIRPVHTAVGFAYALIVFAHVLQLVHLSDVAILSLTAALASAVAIVVTLIRRVPANYWYAVLIVTAIPFVVGVGDVLFLRSGWTALSTGVTFVLALTLVLTTRPGLSPYLRAVAAALLVPSLAVVVVDLGAQLLVHSASPITLPAIAIVVACVLPSTNLIGAALQRRGHDPADARLSRLWIEISTLVTAAVAVLLALVRAAAGLNTSFLVLVIVGIGAAATAVITHRRYGWIVTFASWTGALWSFWGFHGVNVVEPYLLPPALAAALVGAISVIRKLPGVGLYAVGLACAVVPSLAVLAGGGNGDPHGIPWRILALIGGSLLLVILGAVFVGRPADSRLRLLATPTLMVGILAAAGGAIQAVRVARGLDLLWLHPHDPVMVAVLNLSIVAAALAALGARMLATPERRASGKWRWIYMPAVVYLAIGPIVAVRAGWLSEWTLLALTIALLALMITTVMLARTRAVTLPPVWFTFAVAWCVAVAGWSIRSLRVEAFSLPLGIALVVVGVLAMRMKTETGPPRTLNTWPVGFSGSWWLLTPGIVVTFLPSILATSTDPQTARAILVIALALLAILIGSLRRLGAPFILGIIVLPLENITVFAAQIGHTISATSWWITLATAGAVLLVIAVTNERRTSGERGVAARLRDLK